MGCMKGYHEPISADVKEIDSAIQDSVREHQEKAREKPSEENAKKNRRSSELVGEGADRQPV